MMLPELPDPPISVPEIEPPLASWMSISGVTEPAVTGTGVALRERFLVAVELVDHVVIRRYCSNSMR